MSEGVTAKRAASDTIQTGIEMIGSTLDRTHTFIDQSVHDLSIDACIGDVSVASFHRPASVKMVVVACRAEPRGHCRANRIRRGDRRRLDEVKCPAYERIVTAPRWFLEIINSASASERVQLK